MNRYTPSSAANGREQQVFTVTRLNSAVRMILEQDLGLVWLTGELSNLAMPSSGHWYFSLKDLGAQVRCAMFKGNNRRVAFRPQDGMQVLVQARVSLYEPRGDYQLIIESMQPAGDGVLALRFEELKRRLGAEGLFDEGRKRPLPREPRAVGLVTSATGAALHDMLTVLKRRAPDLPVFIYPTQVQGSAAIGQIVAAIALANRRAEVDVLIVGRGGGSLEDLWCFNEEVVARAIANSAIPVISAVGHEVDVTISDFAADLRAPTPSAAAELVAPDQSARAQRLAHLWQRLVQAMNRHQTAARHGFVLLQKRLDHQDPKRRLEQQSQRLDELSARLQQLLNQRLHQGERRLANLELRLQAKSPERLLAIGRRRHQLAQERLYALITKRQDQASHRLAMLTARLDGVSPLATLGRGYSITRTQSGDVINRAAQVNAGQTLVTTLAEGHLQVRVEEVHNR
ncbi:TPA: exodeoxyribonuclease VII large subunit [Aeromonas salmonicida]|uniref:Exodeoxyribonuclease 7 large subunit n=4 Tax=Aeromonas salmonicida TaxID=645 RepID=A4SM17_AERS4|nr:exodeoxyribonuclease VII large subunit [Aeromonas salmonicida]ABO89939.1 exodeoxyribonuclease VII, large subunit [Aeromonas salmonicida subsp. salmonicida A449]ASI23249.1 exodeoxyribonuclease VII large subunit [Aeromonas salmonicida]ASI27564.1 exodeoxyribonuclease VII large subunit [Aeromonas salmonicida]ASI31686.1 exodeoxyribonuclease VII large subunit [Aeromonas salmonicida]ATD39250.1 exodeoxyribonuclease VII large subunit [Aeromonas salmonicida subsp. masoucida]